MLSKDEKRVIRENYKVHTDKEIAAIMSRELGVEKAPTAICCFRRRMGLLKNNMECQDMRNSTIRHKLRDVELCVVDMMGRGSIGNTEALTILNIIRPLRYPLQ